LGYWGYVKFIRGGLGWVYKLAVGFGRILGNDFITAYMNLLHWTSQDYRDIEEKVKEWLSEAAEFIGVPAYTLGMFVHNIGVLSTSALAAFGFDYDVAKIQALITTTDYLKQFGEQMEIYKEDPTKCLLIIISW